MIQIIEQKMTGFDDMLYLSATSDSAGAGRVERPQGVGAKLRAALDYGLVTLPGDIARALLIGIVIGAVIMAVWPVVLRVWVDRVSETHEGAALPAGPAAG